jgi:hypothetical protein
MLLLSFCITHQLPLRLHTWSPHHTVSRTAALCSYCWLYLFGRCGFSRSLSLSKNYLFSDVRADRLAVNDEDLRDADEETVGNLLLLFLLFSGLWLLDGFVEFLQVDWAFAALAWFLLLLLFEHLLGYWICTEMKLGPLERMVWIMNDITLNSA